MTYADKINLIKARKNLSNERLGAIINVCGGAVTVTVTVTVAVPVTVKYSSVYSV